ncbi:TIGR03936 family radical SAM-associated protein [Sporomusa aerivorans]|uniref:TIGR03936 family radical SAM-associated protein n=1 Tax=Sporomusa aerivorans TaxID=204936 RepID=UPI003529EC02
MAKLRFKITKDDQIRYVSHLDYAGTIERAVRRAQLPAAYSEGFNPHMKLSFASALAVGVTSDAEYLDLELTEEADIGSVKARLKPELPSGVRLEAARYMGPRSQALMAVVNLATYEVLVSLKTGVDWEQAAASIDRFNQEVAVIYIKQSPKGRREIDIKEYLAAPVAASPVSGTKNTIAISLAIKITPGGSVKPVEVLNLLADSFDIPVDKENALIHRNGLFVTDGRVTRTPLEL